MSHHTHTTERKVADCFDVITNDRRMTKSELRGFQLDFNVNLNDEDGWFDEDTLEIELTEISDEDFIHSYVMGDDLN